MKLLNQVQEEQLREISKQLVQVRQEKYIRIEEVAAKTHIRLTFLKALDAGQFEELPEPIYIQGFIRRYADILGLDGTALANSFTVNVLPPESQEENPQEDNQIAHKISKIRLPLPVPYVLLSAVAVIGLIYLLNSKLTAQSSANKQDSSPTPVASSPIAETLPSKQDAVADNTAKTTPSPVSTASSPSPKSPDNSQVTVSLELQGNSWIEVKADGKTEFVGNLTKGQRKTWTAENQLTVRSGNAGVVLIAVNEQPATLLGNLGEVKQVTYSAKVNNQ
ncbi:MULTISPECIES: RodZ family helix-turn-helix domain-containing protein [unclassified Anabaena]|uniref:helix-turn-helix domain-containing protein n=1 Tax=unclassified Anabaena TaxID=2619674 RepID=UPI000833B09F|nr:MULTISPECIES: RodZ family helix-turn-helix domain-containing protein [unclassified Anabaena]